MRHCGFMTVTVVNAVNTDIFYVYLETAGVVCLKLVSKEYCTSLNELCVSVCYCDQNAGHYVGQSGLTLCLWWSASSITQNYDEPMASERVSYNSRSKIPDEIPDPTSEAWRKLESYNHRPRWRSPLECWPGPGPGVGYIIGVIVT